MAVTLLRVLVLGVIAAAADDVPITWWSSPRASLPCVIPDIERIPTRRPPPPLNAEDRVPARPKQLYTWRKGDEELRRVSSNGTLEVSRKKDGSSEGLYQCSIRHHAGIILGYPVHLKFAYLDKQFSVHPGNATAWVGQPYVLSCDINSGPPASISWQRDGEPLPKSKRYHVLKNQLLILDVRREDAGLYRCKATNSYANRTRISHGGRLQVERHPEELEVEPSLLPVQHENNIFAGKGERVVLPCPVTGVPKPKLIWEFTAPGQRTAELEQTSEVLILHIKDLDDEGLYTCSVEGHSDLSKNFNLTVIIPVNITLPPVSKQVFRASTVRFNCTAVGNPAPTVTWYKNGKPLTLAGRIVVLPAANDERRMELLIRSVTSEDAGVYQCVARGAGGARARWAALGVQGQAAAAPAGVRCQPRAARHVLVSWPRVKDSMVYTVEISTPGGQSLPSQPCAGTEANITLIEALTPYKFQVRAYVISSKVSSDMSETVTCQGQGVPIRFARLGDDILVSWKQFASQTPGVKQWILQYKTENSSEEHNVTLESAVTNYTITLPSPLPLQVRVLGTKELPWLVQNLTLVPWTSTSSASHDLDSGDAVANIEKVEVTELGSREFTVRWRCDEADTSPEAYVYLVCTRKQEDKEDCVESRNTWVRVEGLWPASEYSVRVKALIPSRPYFDTEFTQPIHVSTRPEGSEHIKDLTYKVVNGSTLRVSWNSVPDKYTVYYNDELKLPINQWPCLETVGNTVLITGVDLSKELYVMVSGYEPVGHSSVLHIPIQVPQAKDLQYTFTSSGVTVTWTGGGDRVVRYSQNLTQSLENWSAISVTGDTVHIRGLDDTLPTYVMVAAPGQSGSQVLTVPARPPDNSSFNLSVGIGCGAVVLCLVAAAAVCIWHKKKLARSPVRTRRRRMSPADGHEEEVAEMKNISGQLANGGSSKEAGEPLLNGHVHITENPNQSKTPNGRMRKGRRYEPSFDVARYEEPDTTIETVLDESSSTTYNLMDTSRRPEYDLSRSSRDLSANNSFSKLPDDNMNSELTRSTDFQLDNSKILPTLQPNG